MGCVKCIIAYHARMALPKKTLYQILGVPRDASRSDIGLAYEMRRAEMERAVPPDPGGLALVRDAYAILSDDTRRAAYDASLLTASEKEAALAQAETDLEIGEDEPAPRKLPVVPIAAGAVVLLLVIFLGWRATRDDTPAAPQAPAVAEAPKPALPPPPQLRSGPEILADASVRSGQLLAFTMSGAAKPVGVAITVGPGAMVTTCHGIPAGASLVVRLGAEQYPADLTVTDETLDVCRLSVAGLAAPAFRLAEGAAREGQKIFAIGMNAKGEMAATEGTVKRVAKTPAGDVLAISVPVSPTGSGGAVVDEFGKLLGIATTSPRFGPNLDIALPAAWISEARSRTGS